MLIISNVFFIIMFIGVFFLYYNSNKETKHIAEEYNKMITYLTSECNIDLNELQEQNIEATRCNNWKRLYEKKIIDLNALTKQGCNEPLYFI